MSEHLLQAHRDNRLLAALPADVLALMSHDLRHVSLPSGTSIYEPGAPIDQIYFPETGMISLMVVFKGGTAVETTAVGREGAVGLHGALGNRLAFTRATTQIGGNFSTIRTGALALHLENHLPLRDLIARYTEILWAEAQQLAACNAVHDASARLCRWLLRCADRIGSDHIPLTQELIAQVLGLRRTTVTLLAQSLQQRNLIKYRRGNIVILDRNKLGECACECHAVFEQEAGPLTSEVDG